MFKITDLFYIRLSESPYGNIYEEANNEEGLDNAAMHQHVESYNQISSARFQTFLAILGVIFFLGELIL